MELIKISRSKSFEMVNGFGLKHWDKLSAEMSIIPGEDPKAGYKFMDELIEEVHRESYMDYRQELPIIQVDKREDTRNKITETLSKLTKDLSKDIIKNSDQ